MSSAAGAARVSKRLAGRRMRQPVQALDIHRGQRLALLGAEGDHPFRTCHDLVNHVRGFNDLVVKAEPLGLGGQGAGAYAGAHEHRGHFA